jgi:hypothetical protein
VVVLGTGVTYLLPHEYISPAIPFLYIFFFAATMLVHYVLLQVSVKKVGNFVNYFMLMTFGKFIFFLSIVLLYALVRREDAAQFIIAFFILYFFFTIFEVIQSLSLTTEIRRQRTREQEKNTHANPE